MAVGLSLFLHANQARRFLRGARTVGSTYPEVPDFQVEPRAGPERVPPAESIHTIRNFLVPPGALHDDFLVSLFSHFLVFPAAKKSARRISAIALISCLLGGEATCVPSCVAQDYGTRRLLKCSLFPGRRNACSSMPTKACRVDGRQAHGAPGSQDRDTV